MKGIEGENDFSGKRYVWMRDPEKAFVRGWIVEDLDNGRVLVQRDDGGQHEVSSDALDKVNHEMVVDQASGKDFMQALGDG